jgi:hypothetical protein
MIGVAPTGALTAAGTDGVGEAIIVGTVFSSALIFSINGTLVLFDGVKTISSVSEKNGASTSSAASTCADTTPVTITGEVVGVTTADGGHSSPVRTSLLVLGSKMRKALDLALRDAPELSRGCGFGNGATGTCCGCWGCCWDCCSFCC